MEFITVSVMWAPHSFFMDSKEKPSKSPLWQDALATLLEDFTPVSCVKEADERFSTDEIIKSLEDHTGEQINRNDVFEIMTAWNYTYKNTGDMTLEWLLKKR